MSSSSTAKQKIRTVQLLLMMCGGALILYGVLRHQNLGDLHRGFSALWASQYDVAREAFNADISEHKDRVESRIGLVLTLMYVGEREQAADIWAWLNSPRMLAPPEDADSTQVERWSSYTRLVEWEGASPRDAQQYRGERLMAEAWMAGYDILRGFARGASEDDIGRARLSYRYAMDRFEIFINRRREQGERNPFSDGEVAWLNRYQMIDEMVQGVDRRTDLQRAREELSLDVQANGIAEASDLKLRNALIVLDRAWRVEPDELPLRSLHFLVLAEAARRNLFIEDLGERSTTLLREALARGADPEIKRSDAQQAEYNLSLAQARIVNARFYVGELRDQEIALAEQAMEAGLAFLELYEDPPQSLEDLRIAVRNALEDVKRAD